MTGLLTNRGIHLPDMRKNRIFEHGYYEEFVSKFEWVVFSNTYSKDNKPVILL